jgi:hypothetical protein
MSYSRTLILSLVTGFLTATPVHRSSADTCGPLLDTSIMSISAECLNDSIAIEVDSSRANESGWQYAFDSNEDGVNNGIIGGSNFEMYGMAILETRNDVYMALNANLPLEGFAHSNTNPNRITWGDLFINLSGDDFLTAHENSELFAVRFADINDAAVSETGVFENVQAMSVTATNRGFGSYGQYYNMVLNAGKVPTFGELGQIQSYYSSAISLNVIALGSKIGEIELLTLGDIQALGYDDSLLTGDNTIAFRFAKDLIAQYPDQDGDSTPDCEDLCPQDPAAVTPDICGVCSGDGTSCLDCAGTPFGTAVLDQCGVCNGDGTSCLDCAGIPNGGTVIDDCGVCGGDNSSCLDCAGTPNGSAEQDQCGVCNGDGLSCVQCTEQNISAKQTIMDSNAKKMDDLGQQALRIFLRNNKAARGGKVSNGARSFARTSRQQLHDYQIDAWTKAWSFTSEITTCDELAQSVCVTVSHAPILDNYRSSLNSLNDVAVLVIKRMRSSIRGGLTARGVSPRAARVRAKKVHARFAEKLGKLYNEALETSNVVPTETTTCS